MRALPGYRHVARQPVPEDALLISAAEGRPRSWPFGSLTGRAIAPERAGEVLGEDAAR